MCTQVVNARRGDVNGIWRWIIFQLSVDLRITNPAPRSQLVLFLLPVLPSPLCLHAPRSQLVLFLLPVLPSPLCLHAPRSQLVLFLLPVLPSPFPYSRLLCAFVEYLSTSCLVFTSFCTHLPYLPLSFSLGVLTISVSLLQLSHLCLPHTCCFSYVLCLDLLNTLYPHNPSQHWMSFLSDLSYSEVLFNFTYYSARCHGPWVGPCRHSLN